MTGTHGLRVLIANQRPERLDLLAEVVTGLGHRVIAQEIHVSEVAAVTARGRPDVALVGLGESSEHALELICEIVRGAFCPVIALLESYDPAFVDQAAERGVYAYIVDTRPEELQSAIDITLRRYTDIQAMQGAFELRNAQAVRDAELVIVRQRQMLELHERVVQGLVVANLNLDLDRTADSREALRAALEDARAIVSHSLEQLQAEGVPLEQLLGDASVSRP